MGLVLILFIPHTLLHGSSYKSATKWNTSRHTKCTLLQDSFARARAHTHTHTHTLQFWWRYSQSCYTVYDS